MLARIGRQGDERMGFMRGPVPGNSLSGCLRLGRHRLDPTEFGRSSAARSQGPAPSSRPLARRCFEPKDESAAIAAAVGASKLVLLTDTNGVLSDKDDAHSTLSELTIAEAHAMLSTGKADRGMIPKLEGALYAIEQGVESVHLINGGTPNSLLVEVFTHSGVGTMIVKGH